MICCGEEINTAFCPKCGKRVSRSNGDGLLLFLTNTRATWEANVNKYSALLDGKPNDLLWQKHLETAKLHLQLWNEWCEWTARMIQFEMHSAPQRKLLVGRNELTTATGDPIG